VQKKAISFVTLAFLTQAVLCGATGQAVAQSLKDPYPVMLNALTAQWGSYEGLFR
jgi:hypothetical protein